MPWILVITATFMSLYRNKIEHIDVWSKPIVPYRLVSCLFFFWHTIFHALIMPFWNLFLKIICIYHSRSYQWCGYIPGSRVEENKIKTPHMWLHHSPSTPNFYICTTLYTLFRMDTLSSDRWMYDWNKLYNPRGYLQRLFPH